MLRSHFEQFETVNSCLYTLPSFLYIFSELKQMKMANLVQYVVVNGDIVRKLNWPLGAVIAQCCHATTAINHITSDDAQTQEYFANLDSMHKVVLEAKSEEKLRALSDELSKENIQHKLWIEMPENLATCLAIKPSQKETIQPFVKKLKLFK